MRRIEALTGDGLFAYYKDIEKQLEEAAKLLKCTPAAVNDKIAHLQAEVKALTSENESLKAKAANDALGNVMDNVAEVKGMKFLGVKVADVDMNELRNLGDSLKEKLGTGVVVLASSQGADKVNLIVTATDDAVK